MRLKYSVGWILALTATAMASGGSFGGGTGSPGFPFLIEDFADLQAVATTAGTTGPSTQAEYRLVNDIDASASPSKSIGTGVGDFIGKFHGGGHKITGLHLSQSINAGLFSVIGASGTVDSLTVLSSRILGDGGIGTIAGSNSGTIKDCQVIDAFVGAATVGTNMGGIVGINNGTIDGIVALRDTVSSVGAANRQFIGGIVGNATAGSIIHNVSFIGKVEGYGDVGGIVGFSAVGAVSIVNATVNGSVAASSSNAGGIVGVLDGNSTTIGLVDSSTSYAAVFAAVSSAAGIVGWNVWGSIRHSSNFGLVVSSSIVGGIVGTNGTAGSSTALGGNLSACSNRGSVGATSTYAATGLSFVGGLIGYNLGGNIDSSFNTGKASGLVGIGGLVGVGNNGGKIRNSYNSGLITAGSMYGGGIVGAWVGSNNAATRDTLMNSYNSGHINGPGQYLGGVVGHGNWGGASYLAMMNCYSVGLVANTLYSGGLIGAVNNTSNNINVVSSYWDSLTSGWTAVVSGMGTKESTAQMFKNSSTTFSGWDGGSIWKFSPDSSIYPGLQFLDNAPFAFDDTLETDSLNYAPSNFLKNDIDLETGKKNLVVKVLSLTGGTLSGDSSSTISFSNSVLNRDSMVAFYTVGEVRAKDTLWGNQATAVVRYIAPWRNTYYALYSGKNLTQGSLPVLGSLIANKIPAITAINNNAVDSTVGGVPWTEIGQEKYASNGFSYVDSFSYVNTKATSHIVANIKPRIFYGGDTVNTLLTEGFFQNTGYYPNIRVSYQSGKIQLDLTAFTTSGGAVTSATNYHQVISRPLNSAAIFSDKWVPVHLIVRRQSPGSNVGVVELYVGSSVDTAKASMLSLTFDTQYFQLTANYDKRVVQIPQYETSINRKGTDVDNNIKNFNNLLTQGFGGAWVGDFAMISSENMTRKDLVTSYLADWKHAGSGTADSASYVAETILPYITKILYAAPGDQSTTSFTTNTSSTGSLQFSAGSSSTNDFFAGVEVEPEALTFETGAEVHVGLHTSTTMNTTNSFTLAIDSYDGVATNSTTGDVVVSNVIKTKSHLYERPRMPYLFTVHPTDAQMTYFIASAPESGTTAEQIQSVRDFLTTYSTNPSVLKNFVNLYAKDTATGLVRSDLIQSHVVSTGSEFILEGQVSKTLTDDVTISVNNSQSFETEIGPTMDSKLTAGGAVVGNTYSFNTTSGMDISAGKSNTFTTDVTFSDNDSWDQHDVIVYKDLRFGVPIYEMQKNLSFTSGPNEPLSMPTTNLGLGITERTDTNCVGDTIEATLKIANNSSQDIHNSLIDSMQIQVDLSDVAKGVYNLLVVNPPQFMLARGDSQSVKVRYRALDTTSIPISFYIKDGYSQNGNYDYLENSTLTGTKKVGTCPAPIDSLTHTIQTKIQLGLVVRGFHGGMSLNNLAGNEVVADTKGRTIFRATSSMQSKTLNVEPGIYLVKTNNMSYKVVVW